MSSLLRSSDLSHLLGRIVERNPVLGPHHAYRRSVAVAGFDNALLVFDLHNGETVAVGRAPTGTQSLGWRPGQQQLSTVGFEAHLWELPA